MSHFTEEERERYSRHLILDGVGEKGQQRLLSARVLVVGAGGLGSPALLYLAAAGVGTIGIVDDDVVDRSNLQRQILYADDAVGWRKAEQAVERLKALNPLVNFQTHPSRLTSQNALEILRGYDLVLDGTDNFPTRYLTNDACVLLGIPLVFASIHQFSGHVSVFATNEGPCYRCLYPQPPSPGEVPSCSEAGVLGILPGVIGTLQATEALKLLLGLGESLAGRLLSYDALAMRFEEFCVKRDPDCPVCGIHPTIRELIDYEQFCGLSPAAPLKEMSVGEYEAWRHTHDHLLIDVREAKEYQSGNMGGVLIPLRELESRLDEIPRDRTIVLHCKSGKRSEWAQILLWQHQFTDVVNLKGGYDAWLARK